MDEIAFGSADELREAIGRGRAELMAAIGGCGSNWNDAVLPSEQPSEERWSPRRAAWHALIVERFRLRYVEQSLRTDAVQPPSFSEFWEQYVTQSIEQRATEQYERTTTTAAMLTATRDEWAAHDLVLDRVNDADLDRPGRLSAGQLDFLRSHGQGTPDGIRVLLLSMATHLTDHAAHIRSAGEAGSDDGGPG